MFCNTSSHCRRLVISMAYNMLIIISLAPCFGADNLVPDFDLQRLKKDAQYDTYHFRKSDHLNQRKLDPNGVFLSAYNCPYFVLPNPEKPCDYETYLEYIKDKFRIELRGKYEELKRIHDIILEDELKQESLFEEVYNLTEKAYAAIVQFEKASPSVKNKFKLQAEIAIQRYIYSPMPKISIDNEVEDRESGDSKYIFKNYEFHVNPTDKAYKRSKMVSFQMSTILNVIDTCMPLSKSEFDDIKFLYMLLPNENDSNTDFIQTKIDFTINFQNSFLNLPRYYKYSDFVIENDKDDNTSNMLKSQFVVNNENYMSYLVRMIKYGYIGFHHKYHKCFYIIRGDNFYPDLQSQKNLAIMDIHQEVFTPEFQKIQDLAQCDIFN